ncbi:MAG: hypothetical protein ACW98D_07995 [Promethearchaeota archaeon]|jgi:hypothetical protein
MKLKLKVKNNKKRKVVAYIQKNKDFDESTHQLFQFFESKLRISKLSRFRRYHIVSSENPAMILSLFSAVQDLIPDIYFDTEEPLEIEDLSSN